VNPVLPGNLNLQRLRKAIQTACWKCPSVPDGWLIRKLVSRYAANQPKIRMRRHPLSIHERARQKSGSGLH
jgi:hypothetical protein